MSPEWTKGWVFTYPLNQKNIVMKNFTLVRNIPFIDTKGFGFNFQRYNNRIWIEIPFFAFSWKVN